jgi:hypothetical protein
MAMAMISRYTTRNLLAGERPSLDVISTSVATPMQKKATAKRDVSKKRIGLFIFDGKADRKILKSKTGKPQPPLTNINQLIENPRLSHNFQACR